MHTNQYNTIQNNTIRNEGAVAVRNKVFAAKGCAKSTRVAGRVPVPPVRLWCDIASSLQLLWAARFGVMGGQVALFGVKLVCVIPPVVNSPVFFYIKDRGFLLFIAALLVCTFGSMGGLLALFWCQVGLMTPPVSNFSVGDLKRGDLFPTSWSQP